MADVLKMNGLDNVAYTPYVYDPSSRLANSNLNAQTNTMILEYEQKKAIFVFSDSEFRDFFFDYSELKSMIQEKPDTLNSKILIITKK